MTWTNFSSLWFWGVDPFDRSCQGCICRAAHRIPWFPLMSIRSIGMVPRPFLETGIRVSSLFQFVCLTKRSILSRVARNRLWFYWFPALPLSAKHSLPSPGSEPKSFWSPQFWVSSRVESGGGWDTQWEKKCKTYLPFGDFTNLPLLLAFTFQVSNGFSSILSKCYSWIQWRREFEACLLYPFQHWKVCFFFFFPGANSKLHPYFRAIGGISQKRFITRHYAAVAVGSRPTDGGLMKLNSYFIARQERFQHKSFPCPLASSLPTVHCAPALCMNLTPQSGEAPAQPWREPFSKHQHSSLKDNLPSWSLRGHNDASIPIV